MRIKMPRAIEAYFDADRDGGPEAIAATFTADGIVKDKGLIHRGRDAIRNWMIEASQLYTYRVEPFFIDTGNGKIQVTAHVTGTFPGSPIDLRYVFVLSDDKVAEMEITV